MQRDVAVTFALNTTPESSIIERCPPDPPEPKSLP